MARPDPALLDPARYPFRCSIETRYRDLDSNLHINNGVFASLLEEGRVRFHRQSRFGNLTVDPALTSMVASVAIDYLGESHFPDPLDVHIAVLRIGNTSYTLAQLVMQRGQPVGYAQVTMVCVKAGKPSPIAPEERDGAQQWVLLG